MSEYINGLSVEHFRLKSLRRKKRWQRENFEKNLIMLYREERAISRQIWSLGFEELNPPIQRGWKRSFILRDDVARSKEAKFFQGVLDKINTVQYSSKKDFKVMRRQRGKKIYVVREQEVEQMWPCSFRKKKFPEAESMFFDLVMTKQRIGKEFLWLYRFREPWRFRLKIEPHIIKWTKVKDFDLERRADEIKHYFDRNNLRPTMQKLIYGRYQWRHRYDYGGDLPKYRDDPFKNRSYADILNEYLPVKEPFTMKLKPSNPEGFFFCRNPKTYSTFTFIQAYCAELNASPPLFVRNLIQLVYV